MIDLQKRYPRVFDKVRRPIEEMWGDLPDDYSFSERAVWMWSIPQVDKLNFTFELPGQKFAKWDTGLHPLIAELHPYLHREVSPMELVFEFDSDSYEESRLNAYHLANVLESYKIPFNAFFSGNRSLHIHAFYDAGAWSDKTTARVEASFDRTRLQQFRAFLFEKVFKSARDYAKGLDKAVGKASRHMCRECGSLHAKTGYAKTYVGSDSRAVLNSLKPIRIAAKGDIADYPPGVTKWMVPEWMMVEFLNKPVPVQSVLVIDENTPLDEEYERFCQKLLQSSMIDKRRRACFILAGYLRRKGVPIAEAADTLEAWGAGHLSRDYVEQTVAEGYKARVVPGMSYIKEVFGE